MEETREYKQGQQDLLDKIKSKCICCEEYKGQCQYCKVIKSVEVKEFPF